MPRALSSCVLAFCALAACAADPVEPPLDQIDAAFETDAAGNVSCDPSRIENVIAERPLAEGDFCDVIELCAASADVAAAVESIEPGFECGGEPRGCAATEIACAWQTPDVIDAGELERLCAISSLEDPPLLRCWVFLSTAG